MDAWNGSETAYFARGRFVMCGPRIEKVCLTKTGARVRAWWRER